MKPEVKAYYRRKILECNLDEKARGYVVNLSCGHEVWMAVEPGMKKMYCAVCLNDFLEQVRLGYHKSQGPV